MSPFPPWLSSLDLLSFVLVPPWFIGSALIRKLFRTEPPPGALFRIQPQQLRMELVDPKSGQTTVAEWPRQRIVESRNNRYEKGLWIHVQGETKRTVLRDVDDETMIVLCGLLQSFLASDDV